MAFYFQPRNLFSLSGTACGNGPFCNPSQSTFACSPFDCSTIYEGWDASSSCYRYDGTPSCCVDGYCQIDLTNCGGLNACSRVSVLGCPIGCHDDSTCAAGQSTTTAPACLENAPTSHVAECPPIQCDQVAAGVREVFYSARYPV